jgi:hypothetical protein
MRDLIRHILKENRLQQELKQVIEDNGIFDAIDMVGGLKNFKKLFKNDPEFSEILDELTGVVDFSYYEKYLDENPILFPFKYEIVGIKKNRWNTNSWPELNLIYDEDKLSPSENETLKSIIAVIQNDNTTGKIKTKTLNFKDSNYFDVTQINGKDVELHEDEFSFSKEDVKRIYNKLYGESESLNESTKNEIDKNLRAINVLLSMVSWDGLCDIWAEYNPDDKEYEIRSKTTLRHFYSDEILEELESLEDSIKSMGIKVYIYAPWFVDNCEGEVIKFMNESLNESINKSDEKRNKVIEKIMDNIIFPEYKHIICGYYVKNDEVFNEPVVNVTFIGGYGTKLWPVTQGIQKMYRDILDEIWDTIYDYINIPVGVTMETTPKCDEQENIYLRESKTEDKEYSPAGKEIIPNEKVFHQSNPMFRNKIEEQGLKVRAGECYKIYAGYGEKCIPAIFATNSSNKRAWFDSSYDDDVWEIDTTKIPNVKWYKDRHYESRSKHIVTFENIPRDAIKLIYEGSSKDSGLMESESKSEDKKLKLVKEMIYSLFDEVEFIEVDTNYEGKPLIKIYHDVDDTAANYDNWFSHRIQDEIKEMTGDGIILSPWWAAGWDWKYKNADFFIDVQKIEYDDEGNVINESDESKQERKFNKLIQNVEDYLNSNEYPSVKKFTVYYEDTHDDVIVNIFFDPVESVKLGGGINSVIKRVGKQVMEDLEVFPMDFKYYIHFDRDINESTEKQPKYLNIIEDLVEPFKDEDGVCDIRVSYDDDDDMYSVYIVMGTEEMNDKFFYVPMIQNHISKLRINVRNTIKDYLPIDNLYVGSYGKPNCNWNPLNESSIKEKSLVKLIEKDGLYDFIEMTGLDFNQVRSLLKHIDNPKELLKQYIREFVLEHGGGYDENYGSIFNVQIPLSDTKYVEDILVHDADSIAIEMWEYHLDEYGHREQKDQYLTTINNLTNEELLSILSWMMETIQNGYRD